jgi:hypothetical protein
MFNSVKSNDTSITAKGMQLAISTCDGCGCIMKADRFRNTIEVSAAIRILKCVEISVYESSENTRNRMRVYPNVHLSFM